MIGDKLPVFCSQTFHVVALLLLATVQSLVLDNQIAGTGKYINTIYLV